MKGISIEKQRENEEEITNLLIQTKREGMGKLIGAMELGGFFFMAPCSSKYHLCCDGGLAQHSLNVLEYATKLKYGFGISSVDIPEESLIICALLHDLGKMGDYGKRNYIENFVRSKSKNKETGEYDQVRSEAEPYKTNKDLMYEEHEIRSVIIASRYIHLSEKECGAILHHNGLYGKLDSAYGTTGFDKTKLAFILHTADMYVSRFVEVE